MVCESLIKEVVGNAGPGLVPGRSKVLLTGELSLGIRDSKCQSIKNIERIRKYTQYSR